MAVIEVKLTGVDGVLDLLKSLPAEVVSKRGGPVKAALRKGALVIQKAELANLQAIIASDAGKYETESTGLLAKNVIVTRGKAPTDGKGERYLVRVKRKTYQRKGGKAVTTLKSAQILEYGAPANNQPARPWIRPAVLSKAQEAILTIETELVKSIDKVVAKLAKQGS